MWTNDPESELKPRLVDLLNDFLQNETSPFVDRLLATLRSKSFLPYTTASEPPSQSQNQGPPRQPRARKRGLEQDEHDRAQERDLRGPPKGPRLHSEKQTRRLPPDGPRSMSQRRGDYDDAHPPDGPSHHGPHDSRTDMGPAPPTGPRAGVPNEMCRDYYEFGFCNRGPSCPYSHGDDAMIAGRPPNGMPFVPPIPPAMALQMLNGFFPPAWQPPFMGMPGPPFGPPMHPPPNGPYDSGIQDLTPRAPRGSRFPRQQNGPRNNNSMPMHGEHNGMYSAPAQNGQNGQPVPPTGIQGDDVSMTDGTPMNTGENGAGPSGNNLRDTGSSRGGRGFGGGRGGRGGRPERVHRSNVVDPNALTLVVEKLPPEKTNISDLSNYFGKFGTVTNVGVDSRGNRALVSFATHQEAHAAWKSEEAVFGNRFVVIFWHRPAPGGGAAGQKALEASAGALQKLNSGAGDDVDMASGDAQNHSVKPQHNGHDSMDQTDTLMETASAPKKADPKTPQEIFEYATRVWLEKMKAVMDVMQSTTTTENEKQEAKTKFKVLKSQKPQPPAAPKPKSDGAAAGDKDKLDLDLDLLASGQGEPLTQEEAQQALARLQELAAERGLDPNGLDNENSSSFSRGYHGATRARGWRGGYRGRGRGRGGAIAMANASLDNRTKEILLQGYDKSGVSDDMALDMVQSFYLPTGQAEEVHKAEPAGVAVKFATRAAAETALRSGPPAIEGLGSLSVRWYNHPSVTATSGTNVTVEESYGTTDGEKEITSVADTISWAAKRPVRGMDDDEDGWQIEDDEDDGGRRRR
ncbi:hypothetical protein M408DRAFT_325895 [Serendipita vermifera MAFF 305830]|uniref:C3H1-type domain-containing protein n=1 Tax=Serendipita vermifera MAFF 305830 TaxID=933852 RepID=A0A0C2Y084_SERVB|nr:hypothetical protein M408DRAFT_325895 [Serendipita vermifera MAFF 305830]